jgi:hypothetical protein
VIAAHRIVRTGLSAGTTTGANPAAGSSVEHGVDNWQIEVCK